LVADGGFVPAAWRELEEGLESGMPSILSGLALAAMLAVGAGTANADTQSDAQQLGRIFCVLGRSDGGQFGRMYLLSRSLTQLVNDALKKNDEIASAKPNDKPPLGDGIPYQSFPETAPVCKPGKLTDKGREQVLEIAYSFPETSIDGWTDQLVLIAEDGRLRIDDVLFGTGENAKGLRNMLSDLIKPAQ
jgi:hypothetical protein